ncbi:WD repeat domain-containing protein [Xylariales sp. AK1849]|nr:WD repeat domain-containing protein [Xylariales sp. AK1849]
MSSSIPANDALNGTHAQDDGQTSALRRGSISPGAPDIRISANVRSRSPLASSPDSPAKKGPAKLSRKEQGGTGKDMKDAKSRNGPVMPLEPAIDPLSHHIFVRTNTDRSIPSRLRTPGRPESPANEGLPQPSSDPSTKQPIPPPDQVKEKKKGASFLSRFSMISTKRKDDDDDDSEISEMRTEGANAVAFGSAVDGGGYIPHHKEPPRYIRVRGHSKKVKEFNRMFLAQELTGTRPQKDDGTRANTTINPVRPVYGFGRTDINTGGPIWAVEFSRDGKFLATAGRDQVVRIWAVISTPEDRATYEEEESSNSSNGEHLSAPVFRTKPVREFTGHTGDILDLSWSKNNFLLSSSMDKTVRLWHMSRHECLCTFKHKDFVTSIAFHPKDDRFFLAGSLDSILRLWSIPDKAVAYSSQLADLITAVSFSPDGKTCIAGCLNGLCTFYETEGLKFQTQMQVRSSRGKNAKGSKITGIQTMTLPPNGGEVKVLITSNDSRIRIYSLRDKSLEMKFKGHENTCNQIRAGFSDDGSYVVCGSEDKKAFIWSTGASLSENKDKRPCESFEAHSAAVTQAAFAPTVTRQLLQASLDPIFTLCNPPPVTLLSKEEASVSQTMLPEDISRPEIPSRFKKPEETPAFISRSKHFDGNILITTDHEGNIKVFRQDCAFTKRRHDNWETVSTFSRTIGRDGLLGRTGSIITRTSASSIRDPHSRRGSINQPPSGVGIGAGVGVGTPQLNSERIMSWRQGIEGTPGTRPSSIALATPARSERSVSPSKARTPVTLASEARRQPYANSIASTSILPTSPLILPTSPTSSVATTNDNRDRHVGGRDMLPSQPPTPSFSFRGADGDDEGLRLDPAGASYSFWNLNRWRGIGGTKGTGGSTGGPSSLVIGLEGGHGRPNSEAPATSVTPAGVDNRRKSMGARLLSTAATGENEDAERSSDRRKSVPAVLNFTDNNHLAPPGGTVRPPTYDRQESVLSTLTSEGLTSEGASEDGEEMQCTKCGGHEFKAKKVGGQQRFLCAGCGRMVDA